MPNEIRFRFLVSTDVVDALARIIDQSIQEERKRDGGEILPDKEFTFQVQHEAVVGQSFAGIAALLVALGGGTGLAAVVRAVAKAVRTVCAKNPNAEVNFDEQGRVRTIKGYSEPEIVDLLERAAAIQNQATINVVRAFDDSRPIRELYDHTTGEYFAPGLGTKPFSIGDPQKAPPDGRQLTAFLDTGVITHHPWIKGRIKKST